MTNSRPWKSTFTIVSESDARAAAVALERSAEAIDGGEFAIGFGEFRNAVALAERAMETMPFEIPVDRLYAHDGLRSNLQTRRAGNLMRRAATALRKDRALQARDLLLEAGEALEKILCN